MLALGLAGMATPVLTYVFGFPMITWGQTELYAPGWLQPLIVVVGFLWILITLHLARATGRLHGRYAKALLVRE
jgi:hypothetical protein